MKSFLNNFSVWLFYKTCNYTKHVLDNKKEIMLRDALYKNQRLKTELDSANVEIAILKTHLAFKVHK